MTKIKRLFTHSIHNYSAHFYQRTQLIAPVIHSIINRLNHSLRTLSALAQEKIPNLANGVLQLNKQSHKLCGCLVAQRRYFIQSCARNGAEEARRRTRKKRPRNPACREEKESRNSRASPGYKNNKTRRPRTFLTCL